MISSKFIFRNVICEKLFVFSVQPTFDFSIKMNSSIARRRESNNNGNCFIEDVIGTVWPIGRA